MREFYSRGKPTLTAVAPRFSYKTKKVFDDLINRIDGLQSPFDATFTLTDTDIMITVRVVQTDASNYKAWSINRNPFVYNDCGSKKDSILEQLQLALLRLG